MIERGFAYLRNMLAASDGNVSLLSSLTGKWLMTLIRCCLVPMVIRSVFFLD